MMRLDEIVESLMWLFRTIIVAGLLAIVWYAMDREPPFAVVDSPQTFASPGGWLRVTADVRRDVKRNCEAEFTRYIFDSRATRYDLGHAVASPQMISQMEKQSPGKLKVAVLVPAGAEPGPARLVTVLEYRCNKVHNFWPISVTTEIPFEIVP